MGASASFQWDFKLLLDEQGCGLENLHWFPPQMKASFVDNREIFVRKGLAQRWGKCLFTAVLGGC